MREIKYKACWHESKLMTNVDTIEFLNDGTRVSDGCMHTGWLGKDCELLQYTGRKDKDGVEVYDGDVITAYFDAINGKYLITYTVKFDEFHSLYPFEDFARYEGPMHFTVIGNRYENPELSKEGPTC